MTEQNQYSLNYEDIATLNIEYAGYAANFATGVVDAFRSAGAEAPELLAVIRIRYDRAIEIARGNQIMAEAFPNDFRANFWRNTAEEYTNRAALLSDATKSATQRLLALQVDINRSLQLGAVGRYLGPTFDIFAVAQAIRNGDGNKAGEAALSIGLASFGTVLFAGSATFLGAPAALITLFGGVGAVGGALLADPLNGSLLRPVLDVASSWLPDSFFNTLERGVFGAGAARLDASGSFFTTLLLGRIDNTVQLNNLGRLFDVAASARVGRETVGLVNQLGRIFTPTVAPLTDASTDAQLIEYAGRIAVVTDRIPGGIRISAELPTASDARNNFGALLTLQAGNTISIRLTDQATSSAAALELSALHRAEYEGWLSDRRVIATGANRAGLYFSDAYLNDRVDFLRAGALVTQQEIPINPAGYLSTQGTSTEPFNTRYIDQGSKTQVEVFANRATPTTLPNRYIVFGTSGVDLLDGDSQDDRLYGGGIDRLTGKGGNDHLEGGASTDIYVFDSAFGKDTITDSDGLGLIQLDGYAITTTKASGQRNVWVAELGAGTGKYAGLAVYDDTRSSTGQRLVITRDTTDNTITLNNFNLAQAQTEAGYLGIKLDNKAQSAITASTAATSPYAVNGTAATNFNQTISEGSAAALKWYGNLAAAAGDTLTVTARNGANVSLITGNDTLSLANPITLELATGQTERGFALVSDKAIDADQTVELVVTYNRNGEKVDSNTFTLTRGRITNTKRQTRSSVWRHSCFRSGTGNKYLGYRLI